MGVAWFAAALSRAAAGRPFAFGCWSPRWARGGASGRAARGRLSPCERGRGRQHILRGMLLDPAGARGAPVDCEAVVRANTRLSTDYHVLTLDAPDVAARTRPGQFVMVKPGRGLDPLLRRPFSVFQILRDDAGTPTGVSI